MNGLAEFLRARYDEQRVEAEAMLKGLRPEPIGAVPWLNTEPVVHPNISQAEKAYSRVLREVEAKRQVVALAAWHAERNTHVRAEGLTEVTGEAATEQALRRVLVLLAEPYADHPDYDEGWRP